MAAPSHPNGELTEKDSIEAASKITLSSIKEAAKTKGMWAGALKPIEMPDLLGAVPAAQSKEGPEGDPEPGPEDNPEGDPESGAKKDPAGKKGKTAKSRLVLVEIDRAHTPALLKIIDEIIVNATDHATGQRNAPASQRVTYITVQFDPKHGRITVTNNGPGIPVVPHAEATASTGRTVYSVEVSFAWFLAGTNIHKEITNVKGGINGLGAKLANVHSTIFEVETVDAGTGRYYHQVFRNRLDETGAPTVIPIRGKHGLSPEQVVPHTTVSFVPAYESLGYKVVRVPGEEHPRLLKADADDFDAWLRLRVHQAAAYVGPKVAVTYNGDECETTDAASLGRLLASPLGEEAGQAIVLSSQAKATEEPYKQHPWSIAIVVLPPGKKAGRRAAAQNMTIINGVLSNKGSHIQYLKRMLSDAVEDKLRKATKRGRSTATKPGAATAKVLAAAKKGAAAPAPAKAPEDKKMSITETLAGVRLVVCGRLPGADWSGQRKDELSAPKGALERYSLSAAFLKQVGDTVSERILIAQGAKTGKVVHDKYTKARNAGKAATKKNTYLMAAEGDSAITFLRAGLTQARGKGAVPPGGPSLDWCGIISLQGVIVNAAREVTEVATSSGEVINVRSAKLQTNKRLLALADAFGLRYDRTYTTPEELATLNYGQLLLCVDQDLDGTGKIAALVLVWIYLFWPALIRAGRVGRFMTPLVRVYPKKAGGKVEEFFYEEELKRWLAANPNWDKTHHAPKYYKGIAGHDGDEVKRMFTPEAFRRSLYTYTMDEGAKRLFEVYFGANAALRKEVLVTPVQHLTYEKAVELHRRREIPVGAVQLDIDTKSYKNDAIKRQIPSAVDGLNPARRKILLGAIMRFGKGGSDGVKVFQLGGYVADKCFYHHGDSSLNHTIVYLAQEFPGARQYPYLIGIGQFGSRHGDEAGSARYISVKLSPLVEAAFPSADRWLIPYVFEDGQRAEPSYFVPVAPMAVLESYEIVSEGWNHDSFGRDFDQTMAVVEAYIRGDPDLIAAADLLHKAPLAEALPVVDRLAKMAWPLPASRARYEGEVRPYRGELYSFGVYSWDAEARLVVITELPIGVATAKYLESLVKPGRNAKASPRLEYIEDIEDRSSSDKVEIHIKLQPEAFEKISADYGDSTIDALEDFLMLRASLRPHLNYYSVTGGVLEFAQNYLAPLLYWAPIRRDLYAERLTREKILTELRILEETEIIRYIAMAAALDLANIEDDKVASAKLKANLFPVIDHGLLHRPGYTPCAELRGLITAGPGADHSYILDLRDRDHLLKAVEKRQETVAKLREDLARTEAQLAEKPIAGASVWLAELAEFRKVVSRGIATGWKFK